MSMSDPFSPKNKIAVLGIISALAIGAVCVIALLVYTGVADSRITIVTGFATLALVPIITAVLQVVNHNATNTALATVVDQTNGKLTARLDATAQQAANLVIAHLNSMATLPTAAPEHMLE